MCVQMWHLGVFVSIIHAQGHRAPSLQRTHEGSGTLRVHLQQALPCAERPHHHPHTSPTLLAIHAPLCCPLQGLPASLFTCFCCLILNGFIWKLLPAARWL